MKFEDLTPEQKDRAKGCKSTEELLAIAKEEGFELTDEELQGISGGEWDCWDVCSKYTKPDKCNTRNCNPFGIA